MKLRDVVIEKAILPNLQATERDDALNELVDSLVKAGAVKAKQKAEFLEALLKRENRGSTGVGHGVAIPHVKHPEVKKLGVAIGVSARGVEFNSLDKQPVYSIFLLLSPEDRPEDHLDAMEAIFGNLQQPTFRRFLQQARSVEDVLTLLDEADAKAPMR